MATEEEKKSMCRQAETKLFMTLTLKKRGRVPMVPMPTLPTFFLSYHREREIPLKCGSGGSQVEVTVRSDLRVWNGVRTALSGLGVGRFQIKLSLGLDGRPFLQRRNQTTSVIA